MKKIAARLHVGVMTTTVSLQFEIHCPLILLQHVIHNKHINVRISSRDRNNGAGSTVVTHMETEKESIEAP